MTADTIFGERVHAAMWSKRLTQRQLAAVLGIGQPAAARKVRGERGWSLDEVIAVSRWLNIPLDELMPGTDYQPVLRSSDNKAILSQTG